MEVKGEIEVLLDQLEKVFARSLKMNSRQGVSMGKKYALGGKPLSESVRKELLTCGTVLICE